MKTIPQIDSGWKTFQEALALSGLAEIKDITFHGLKAYQESLLRKMIGLYVTKNRIGAEVSGGGGKTILSAAVAKEVANGGKILFISTNPSAFDHFENEYKKVLGDVTVSLRCFSGEADVNMLTPTTLKNEVDDRTATAAGILKQTTFIVLDEVHRIPDDPEGDTKVIGRVLEIIKKYASHAKIMAMSGTFYRTDNKSPAGLEQPDFKITMQDLILAGEQPPLYGISVGLDVDLKPGEFSKKKEEIILKMARKKMTKYLSKIVDAAIDGCILPEMEWAKKNNCLPGGHCFFVSRQSQAVELASLLNKRLGKEAFVTVTSDSTKTEDMKGPDGIIERLKRGDLMGYVTVSKGAESLDIPLLKYCHLVARITSDVKLMQCVFRVMRPAQKGCGSKNMACVVDYQIKKIRIMRLALGLRAVMKNGGSSVEDPINGGEIFASPSQDSRKINGIRLSEHEAWLSRGCQTQSEVYRAILLSLAKAKWPKPNTSWTLKKLSDSKYLVKDKKNKLEMVIDV